MSRNHLIVAILVAVLAAGGAAAVIAIELGLAFQSQSDSEDDIPVGDYVKARDYEDKMVSISPVVYAESQDKESFVLSNTAQSVIGTMEIGTKNNESKGLTTLITFQEQGTWMFVETMDLTLQREICFTVVVDFEIKSLPGTTVITIDDKGHVGTARNDTAVIGSWKVWGVGPVKVDYDPSNPANVNDPYKGFLVLVDSTYIMTHHYNVILVSGTVDALDVSLKTPKSIGDVATTSGEWMSWTGTLTTGYALKSTDIYRCTDQAVKVNIYDSTITDGVAGRQTSPITVCTGFYGFSIDINYKSQIKINPANYQGANMKSNIVFFLSGSQTYPVTYNITNGNPIPSSEVSYHAEFVSAQITPLEHYLLPDTVSVTMGGQVFTAFEYSKSTGKVTIAADKIEGALVITAVNTPEEYTVTLALNGGTLAHTPTGWTENAGVYSRVFGYATPYQDIIATITYSGQPIEPTIDTPGQVFKGWNPSTGTLGAADANLTAQYDTAYAITFANGTHGTVSAKIKGGAAIATGDKVVNGATVVFTYTPTDEGYHAVGWEGNVKEVTIESAYALTFTESNTYAVTFADGNHGSITAAIKNGASITTGDLIAYGTVIVFTYAPSDAGYSAVGFTGNELEVTIHEAYDLELIESIQYTLTLDKGTGGTTDGTATVAYGATALTSKTDAVRTHYNLTGYYTAATDGTKVLNADGTFAASTVTGYIADGKWNKASDGTLYAQWAADIYTITLDKGTGGTTDGTATVAYGAAALTSKTDATKTNHHLTGYYTAASSGTKVLNADGSFAAALVDGYIKEGKWIKSKSITLYAQWAIDSYTITLDKGTEGTADGTATVEYNATALMSKTDATKTGYHLTGYYTAATDGTKVLNDNGSFADTNVEGYITDGKWTKASNCTLYAQWEADT